MYPSCLKLTKCLIFIVSCWRIEQNKGTLYGKLKVRLAVFDAFVKKENVGTFHSGYIRTSRYTVLIRCTVMSHFKRANW